MSDSIDVLAQPKLAYKKEILRHKSIYELAKSQDDTDLQKFCGEILQVFENNNINGHIEWKR